MEYPVFDQEALTRAMLVATRDYGVEHTQVALRDGGPPGPATHVVRKAGEEQFRGTAKQCDVYAHKATNMSWDWETRHNGWTIEPIPD